MNVCARGSWNHGMCPSYSMTARRRASRRGVWRALSAKRWAEAPRAASASLSTVVAIDAAQQERERQKVTVCAWRTVVPGAHAHAHPSVGRAALRSRAPTPRSASHA
eukprot:scaffold1928_cov103-Isochrysis_galbana.AAC.4